MITTYLSIPSFRREELFFLSFLGENYEAATAPASDPHPDPHPHPDPKEGRKEGKRKEEGRKEGIKVEAEAAKPCSLRQ